MLFDCTACRSPPKHHFHQVPGFEHKRNQTHEDRLAHKRELLPLPHIPIIQSRHQDIREHDPDILVDLQPYRRVHARRGDVVPVEAPFEEPETFVVGRAAEDVAHDAAGVVGEADDGDAGEEGEDD